MARSAWLRHVMAVKAKNKGMAFKDVLKMAKRSYKRVGGGIAANAAPVGGADEAAPEDAGVPVQQKGGEEAAQEGGHMKVLKKVVADADAVKVEKAGKVVENPAKADVKDVRAVKLKNAVVVVAVN